MGFNENDDDKRFNNDDKSIFDYDFRDNWKRNNVIGFYQNNGHKNNNKNDDKNDDKNNNSRYNGFIKSYK